MSEWETMVRPIVGKLLVAERFGKEAVFNREGSKALRLVIQKMATTLDEHAQYCKKPTNT